MDNPIPRGYSAWSICLLALVVAISSDAGNHTYNVYPTCNDSQCLTFADIVNASDKYFTSNNTMIFHSGDHNLQGEVVTVANISGLTLMSDNDHSSSDVLNPRILCGNSSLSFSGVS